MQNYILGGCLLSMLIIVNIGAILAAVPLFKDARNTLADKVYFSGMLAFLFIGDIFFVTLILSVMKVIV